MLKTAPRFYLEGFLDISLEVNIPNGNILEPDAEDFRNFHTRNETNAYITCMVVDEL